MNHLPLFSWEGKLKKHKTDFQTAAVLCFSVHQYCSSNMWTSWEIRDSCDVSPLFYFCGCLPSCGAHNSQPRSQQQRLDVTWTFNRWRVILPSATTFHFAKSKYCYVNKAVQWLKRSWQNCSCTVVILIKVGVQTIFNWQRNPKVKEQ